jgi:hypothetical protein
MLRVAASNSIPFHVSVVRPSQHAVLVAPHSRALLALADFVRVQVSGGDGDDVRAIRARGDGGVGGRGDVGDVCVHGVDLLLSSGRLRIIHIKSGLSVE